MKVQTVLKKTVLATALAAAAAGASFSAIAGTVTVAPAVIAEDIFGQGSETTAVALPTIAFASTTLAASLANESTIKLTMGDLVVFAESYDTTANWATQGVAITVGGTVLDSTNSKVTAGGTANNNQITITLTAPGLDLQDIKVTGLKVRNLTQYLAANTEQEVKAALEVRAHATGDSATDVDTAPAQVVIVSAPGIVLNKNLSPLVGERVKISADEDYARKLFTGVVAPQPFIDFGTITIGRGTYTGYGLANIPVKKEDNTLFDLVGSDQITLGLQGSADLQGYGKFKLIAGTDACDSNSAAVFTGGPVAAGVDTVALTYNGQSSVLNKPLRLCAEALTPVTATSPNILAQDNIKANLSLDYFSARYVDVTRTTDLGKVELEKGLCQVTLFNLPNVNAADNAFIRFTNTSNVAGAVKASVWSEDGKKLDANTQILAGLEPHATAVFHTNANQTTGTYLGAVLPEFAATGGRSRIVLEGEFSSCEALGLVRSNNGTLVNMTSTVYSGSANNTSNTEN